MDYRKEKVKMLSFYPVGDKVTAQGWVKTIRHSKAGLSFIHLVDGSCLEPYQVIARKTLKNYDAIKALTSGCSLEIKGTIIESRGKGQKTELEAESIKIFGLVEDPATYPIQPKDHTAEHLRSVLHLRPRSMVFGSVMRIRCLLATSLQRFLSKQGFSWIHTPIITGFDCEGAGEMFALSAGEEFFGVPAHLTVSGQLAVEPFACSMGKVYTFGPTFRAEKSDTSRHLSEFWMLEPEMAFADLDDNIAIATQMLRDVARDAAFFARKDIEFLSDKYGLPTEDRIKYFEDLTADGYERISYTEAVDILLASGEGFQFPVKWGSDLQAEHEKYLCSYVGGKILVVTDYPKDIKPFYMRLNDDGRTVAAMDILLPGIGEVIGGSQREERYDILLERIREFGLSEEEYSWYLDLRKYGTVPHAGFGLGFERFVQYISGVPNIRDVIPYPRAYKTLRY